MSQTKQFQYLPEKDGVIATLQAAGYLPSVTIELIDGAIYLRSREYIKSPQENKTTVMFVKQGQLLDITVSLSDRALVTVEVNSFVVTAQLNWPSYRNEWLVFTGPEVQEDLGEKLEASLQSWIMGDITTEEVKSQVKSITSSIKKLSDKTSRDSLLEKAAAAKAQLV